MVSKMTLGIWKFGEQIAESKVDKLSVNNVFAE